MPLRVSGKNIDIGEALREHVVSRVAQAVSKHFSGDVTGHVTLTRDGTAFRCDCQLHPAGNVILHGEGRGHEPYATFEQALQHIEKRLRRHKRKLKDRGGPQSVAGAAAGGDIAVMTADYYVLETPGGADEDAEIGHDYSPLVIAENTTRMPVASVADAVAELDLSGAPVMVFRHAGNGRVNVIYRRADGNIGWIDPPAPGGDRAKAS
jgi:ribosomal subunit interface protein